jgi:phage gp29-like protein
MAKDLVKKQPQPPLGEVATAQRNFFEPIFNGLLRPRDETLLTRGGGKGLWIYDELERDPHCYAVLQKRKLSVISREWQLDPATDSAADKAAAALVERQLRALPFDRICLSLLDAVHKGFSIGETMWDVSGPEVRVAEVLGRDQRRFVFDESYQPKLLTLQNPVWGEVLPERKFIVHRFGSKDNNPYGLGLGTRLFWPVFFKRQGLQFWLTFCDKYGSPTALGEYPVGATPEQKQTLLAALQAISQEGALTVPQGMIVKFLEAQRSGTINTYETLCRYMDEQVSEAVLGETMSTTAHSSGLGSQQARVHNEVRIELTRADADLLANTLNESLVAWIIDYNLPGANRPRLYWDVAEPTDLMRKSQTDYRVWQMGFKPGLDYIRNTYGEGWDVDPAAANRGRGAGGAGDAGGGLDTTGINGGDVNLAEGQLVDVVDRQVAVLGRAADPGLKAWIARLRKLVENATSLEDLRDQVLSAYPDLSADEISKAMQGALAAAQLAGRFDILDETR